jgi:hypothetical protein
MDNHNERIDLNAAEIKELIAIPGIGPKLGERIIAERPYQRIDDLLAVSGISPAMLERILPYLTLPVEDEPEASPEYEEDVDALDLEFDEAAVSEDVMGEPVQDGDQETEPQAEPQAEPANIELITVKRPTYMSRAQVWWVSFVSSLFTFILGVAATFGILIALNGGLRFVPAGSLAPLAGQVEGVENSLDLMATDIGSLRTRMDNLDGLSGRVDAVETTAGDLQSDLDALTLDVDAAQAEVAGLSATVAILEDDSDKYQGFINGLYEYIHTFTEGEGQNE